MNATATPAPTFEVRAVRDTTGGGERLLWCVSQSGGRELGRFATTEAALRGAVAYARTAIQKGEAPSAVVVRVQPDGSSTHIHVTRFGG